MPILTEQEWDIFTKEYPNLHLLQTTAWGDLKAEFDWDVIRIKVKNVGAQLLFRHIVPGFSWGYIPKGPVGDDWDLIWPDVDELCRRHRAIFLKVEPDLWAQKNQEVPTPRGFNPSPHIIQPVRTLVIDINGDEEQVLNRMKQKTRYNIKLALKKGIVVRPSSSLEIFYNLMEVTRLRDRFSVHTLAYYHRAYELFHPRGACELLMAEYQGEPLAALMVFAQGKRAWYLYGASSNEHRDRMPTYLLQWEAIRWARSQGCNEYDLWGVPDKDEEILEAQFADRSDGLWGVYRFKRGFGGELHRAAGPWDRVYQPTLYTLYRWWTHRSDRGN
jgi:lipid II:glycine glycyltransferase (peptidoglycan interpeptide bridge formation enzyme)